MGRSHSSSSMDWEDYYRRLEHARIYSSQPLQLHSSYHDDQSSHHRPRTQSRAQQQTVQAVRLPFKIIGMLDVQETGVKLKYQTSESCKLSVYANAREQVDAKNVTRSLKGVKQRHLQLPQPGQGSVQIQKCEGSLIVKFQARDCNMLYYSSVAKNVPTDFTFHKIQRAGRADYASRLYNNKECVICMSQPCKVVLRPCHHLCLCKTCSAELLNSQNKNCPQCRSEVQGKIQLE